MVNLRGVANSITRAINPNVYAQLWKSTGDTTNAAGKRTPIYAKSTIVIQLQAMDAEDLKQMDGLNIQGIHRKVYCNPQVFAIVRVAAKGGDLLVFPSGRVPEGTTWLATHVLEPWSPWCAFAITLQNDNLSPTPPFP